MPLLVASLPPSCDVSFAPVSTVRRPSSCPGSVDAGWSRCRTASAGSRLWSSHPRGLQSSSGIDKQPSKTTRHSSRDEIPERDIGMWYSFDRSTIALFCYPVVFNAPDGGVPMGRPHFTQRSKDDWVTKWRKNTAKSFNPRVWHTNVTDDRLPLRYQIPQRNVVTFE